jgi:hypothetical protein
MFPVLHSRFEEVPQASFQNNLSGAKAFYAQPDYLKATRRDMAHQGPLPTTYRCDTESKVVRRAKTFFSYFFVLPALYKGLQCLAARIILPGVGHSEEMVNKARSSIVLQKEWRYKRITIEVDGNKIDAMIKGRESTLNNGTWVLASNGNAQLYETKLAFGNEFENFLYAVNGNAIVFNYPGVGASSGVPTRESMTKAYRAVLKFLEEEIRAKKVIGYGLSIGGGAQGDALNGYELKKGVEYVFVKDRTFSDLSTITSCLTCKMLGWLVRALGWNLDSVSSSKKLQAPEVIVQTAHVSTYEVLQDSRKIKHDGVIPVTASLAKALLDDKGHFNGNKVFIGIPEMHNGGLKNPWFVAGQIDQLLRREAAYKEAHTQLHAV